jgi:hypothetical protein
MIVMILTRRFTGLAATERAPPIGQLTGPGEFYASLLLCAGRLPRLPLTAGHLLQAILAGRSGRCSQLRVRRRR